ncbi:MAG: protein-methionine-sulfoxide reductase heme-binding subunit MsrQ [Gammaproteobacteria bacterium]|nr:MAG: protein-methionine-sulfoxide reductase heme-binding subunit MsrQ [Gammaproteobacteria bacterium]
MSSTLTQRRIRLVGKPLAFALALLPLSALLAGAAGVRQFSLGANPVEHIQDTTGIWALRFLLLTLAMTPLRLATGQPWPLQFRRMLGLFAFSYAALHFANYLLLDRTLNFAEIIPDITKRPYITIGFTALVLLVPLAVTSTAGWRRRLGAHWLRLHRLVYLIAALACWHFWWQVKKDITEPLVYAALLAALLGVRAWRERAHQRL